MNVEKRADEGRSDGAKRPDAETSPKPRSLFRRVFSRKGCMVGLGSMVILLLFLYLLRFAILGGIIRSNVEVAVAEQLGGRVTIDHFSGRVFDEISLHDVEITDLPEDSPLRRLWIDQLKVEYDLWGAIRGKSGWLSYVSVRGSDVDLDATRTGSIVRSAPPIGAPTTSRPSAPPVLPTLRLRHAIVRYVTPDGPIRAENLSISLDPKKDNLHFIGRIGMKSLYLPSREAPIEAVTTGFSVELELTPKDELAAVNLECLNLLGGQGRMDVSLQLPTPALNSYLADVSLSGVHSEDVIATAGLEELPLDLRLDLNLHADLPASRSDWTDAQVDLDLKAPPGNFRDFAWQNVEGRFEYRNGLIQVPKLNVTFLENVAAIHGTIGTEGARPWKESFSVLDMPLDLTLDDVHIPDLHNLLPITNEPRLHGEVAAQNVSVSGTLGRPLLRGEGRGYNVNFTTREELNVEEFRSSFSAMLGRKPDDSIYGLVWEIFDGVGYRGGEEVLHVSGTINTVGIGELTCDAKMPSLAALIGEIAQSEEAIPFTGEVDVANFVVKLDRPPGRSIKVILELEAVAGPGLILGGEDPDSGFQYESLYVRGRFSPPLLDVYEMKLTSAKGGAELSGSWHGQIKDGIVGQFGDLKLTQGDHTVVAEQPFELSAGEDGVLMKGLKLRSQDTQADVNVFQVRENGDLVLDADLTRLDLSDFAVFFPDEIKPSGVLVGDATIDGPVTAPVMKLNLEARQIKLGDRALHDILMEFDYAEDRLQIQKLELQAAGGRLAVTGSYPVSLALNGQPFADRLRNGTLTGEIRLDGVQSELLLETFGLAPEIVGEMNGLLRVSGTSRNPLIRGRLQLEDGRVRDIALDESYLALEYVDRSLQIRRGRVLVNPYGRIDVYGKYPIDLSNQGIREGVVLQDDARISLRFTSSTEGLDLQLLPEVDDFIERSRGRLHFDLTATGSPNAPMFNGSVRIEDGFATLANYVPDIRGLNGTCQVVDNRITDAAINGKMGQETISMQGGALFRIGDEGFGVPEYRVDLSGQRVLLLTGDDIRLRGDLNLRLEKKLEDEGALFSGSTRIAFFRYYRNFELASEGGNRIRVPKTFEMPSVPGVDWIRFDVKVYGDEEIIIDNNFAYVSGQLNGTLSGTMDAPVYVGFIKSEQGLILLPTARFEISDAEIRFGEGELDVPTVYLNADSTVGLTRIFLRVAGPITEPVPTLSSEPPHSQTDLLALITTGSTVTEAKGQATTSIATYQVTRWLENSLFTTDPEFSGRDRNPGLFDRLSFEADYAPSTSEPMLNAEYRFSSRFSLLGTRDERGEYGLDFQYRLRFR